MRGKELTKGQTVDPFMDHPRMCGEKFSTLRFLAIIEGSPPHVRGKAWFTSLTKTLNGITPACAGKSPKKFSIQILIQDHPRMCGEKQHLKYIAGGNVGSPPHVRGKDPDFLRFASATRITPACAGKSRIFLKIFCKHRDHPRMCGEKIRAACVY